MNRERSAAVIGAVLFAVGIVAAAVLGAFVAIVVFSYVLGLMLTGVLGSNK